MSAAFKLDGCQKPSCCWQRSSSGHTWESGCCSRAWGANRKLWRSQGQALPPILFFETWLASHRLAQAARALLSLWCGSSCLLGCAYRHGVTPRPLKVPGGWLLEWDHWDIMDTLRIFILHHKCYLFRQLVLKQLNQVDSLLLENTELLIWKIHLLYSLVMPLLIPLLIWYFWVHMHADNLWHTHGLSVPVLCHWKRVWTVGTVRYGATNPFAKLHFLLPLIRQIYSFCFLMMCLEPALIPNSKWHW